MRSNAVTLFLLLLWCIEASCVYTQLYKWAKNGKWTSSARVCLDSEGLLLFLFALLAFLRWLPLCIRVVFPWLPPCSVSHFIVPFIKHWFLCFFLMLILLSLSGIYYCTFNRLLKLSHCDFLHIMLFYIHVSATATTEGVCYFSV